MSLNVHGLPAVYGVLNGAYNKGSSPGVFIHSCYPPGRIIREKGKFWRIIAGLVKASGTVARTPDDQQGEMPPTQATWELYQMDDQTFVPHSISIEALNAGS